MTGPDPVDGLASLVVHGDPTPTSDTGVPVPSSPPEAPGLASRAPERDATAGPRSVPPARSGDQAAKDEFWSDGPSLVELDAYGDYAPERRTPGLRGQAARDAIRAAENKLKRGQRAARGRYTRVADRAPGVSYRAGGNRRDGRT